MTAFDRFLLIFGAGLICFGMCIWVTHAKAGECGIASWYGPESGHRTANGEAFPTREATAAHRSLPFGAIVIVRNVQNGRIVRVRINDRGPAAWTHRIIDLSPAAKRALGMGGLASVCLSLAH